MKKLARVDIESLKPLEQFIESKDNPKYFFTMTEIKKIGINPRTQYDTPAAVCAYPLTQDYYNKLIRKYGDELPFAGNKPYIFLFTISDKVNVMTSYSESDLEKDIKTLKRYFPEIVSDKFIDAAFKETTHSTPIGKFWNLTRLLASRNLYPSLSKIPMRLKQEMVQRTSGKDWSHLLRNLGYTNFYDPGTGLMYSEEPYQFMVFDTTVIDPIDTYLNPFGKVSFREVEDPNRPGKTIMQPVERIEEADKDIFYRKTHSSLEAANEIFFSFIGKNIKNNNIPFLLKVINSDNDAAKANLIKQIFDHPDFITNYQFLIKFVLENNIANYDMKSIIFFNSDKITDIDILEKLLETKDLSLVAKLAELSSNKEILLKLSKSTNVSILKHLIQNHHVDESILDSIVDNVLSDIINTNFEEAVNLLISLSKLLKNQETLKKILILLNSIPIPINPYGSENWHHVQLQNRNLLKNKILENITDENFIIEIINGLSKDEIISLIENCNNKFVQEILLSINKDFNIALKIAKISTYPEILKKILLEFNHKLHDHYMLVSAMFDRINDKEFEKKYFENFVLNVNNQSNYNLIDYYIDRKITFFSDLELFKKFVNSFPEEIISRLITQLIGYSQYENRSTCLDVLRYALLNLGPDVKIKIMHAISNDFRWGKLPIIPDYEDLISFIIDNDSDKDVISFAKKLKKLIDDKKSQLLSQSFYFLSKNKKISFLSTSKKASYLLKQANIYYKLIYN